MRQKIFLVVKFPIMPKGFPKKLNTLSKTARIRKFAGVNKQRHKKLFGNSTTGFTLIEVIFAVFIITVAIGGAFALLQRNISIVAFLDHRATALGLAQEGMEVVFNIRNSNYIAAQQGIPGVTFLSNGLNACGTWCEVECIDQSPPPPYAKYYPNCAPLASGLVSIQLGTTHANKFIRKYDDPGFYSIGSPPDINSSATLFKRKIVITQPNSADCPAPDCLKLVVEVFWNEKGAPQTVTLETRMYNWLGI